MALRIFAVATIAVLLLAPASAQQSHWASADDPAAKYIIDMERKWAEGACVDNGVVSGLLADDFQGTSSQGARFTKADVLKDEKSAHTAHDCGPDEAKCVSSETASPSSMAANMLSVKTSPRYARFGPTPG